MKYYQPTYPGIIKYPATIKIFINDVLTETREIVYDFIAHNVTDHDAERYARHTLVRELYQRGDRFNLVAHGDGLMTLRITRKGARK